MDTQDHLRFAEAAIKLCTEKISGYAGGYGTILFFEDTAVIETTSTRIPGYEIKLILWE